MTIALTTTSVVRFPTSLIVDGSDAMYANDFALSDRTDFHFVIFVGIPTVIFRLPTLNF